MEIKLKTVEESQVASISHTGPVEEMGGIIEELAGWITQKELRVTQPPFAVYYTRPVEVPPDKMQYEIGIPFQGDTNGDKRVRIKIMPKHKILSAIHKGPYEEIGSVYAEVMQYITEGNYEMIGAPREVYITISGEVPDNELLTEVIFPVISPENFEDSGNDSNLTGQSEKLIKQEKKLMKFHQLDM